MESREFSADSLASMGDAHSPIVRSHVPANLTHIAPLHEESQLSFLQSQQPKCLPSESPSTFPNPPPQPRTAPMESEQGSNGAAQQTGRASFDSPRIQEFAETRTRSASEPVTLKKSADATNSSPANPVLLRFISSSHLFNDAVLNPKPETKSVPQSPKVCEEPLPKQPRSPVLLSQTSLTKLQLSPSFKHKATLERSLSSNLSLKKPIKLMPKPAPLPDAVSPAQLARSDSESPAVLAASQRTPFRPPTEIPQRQDSTGSEAFSTITAQSSTSSEGSGSLHSMGSLNVMHQGGGMVHSQFSANDGLPPGGQRLDPSFSNAGAMVQLASAHPVLAPSRMMFQKTHTPSGRGQTTVSSQVHPVAVVDTPVLVKPVQTKTSFGFSLKKLVFKSPKKSLEISRDAESGAPPASLAAASNGGEVWSDVHIEDAATASAGWKKPFADPNYVPQWSSISTNDLIARPAPARMGTILSYLVRDRDKKHQTFRMYTQENTVADRLLLLAKFHSRGPMSGGEYIVAKTPRGLQTKDVSDGYCGRVRSNFSGSRFQFYDHTVSEKQMWTQQAIEHTQGAVSWESTANTLAGGWQKMGVAVRSLDEESPVALPAKARSDGEPGPWSPRLWDSMEREGQCHCLLSKEPEHKVDEKGRESFFLQYGDRCNYPSKRNFQLVSKRHPEAVVCLLGKVEQDTFALDYSYPLSAFQAFCIALTSINDKWCFAV